MSAVAVAFCLLWLSDHRSTKRDTVIVELGPIANGPTFSLPVFVNFRKANGKEMFATTLHNGLEPSVFTLARGTYLVSVEQCGANTRVATRSVTLVEVIFPSQRVRGRTVCIVRPG